MEPSKVSGCFRGIQLSFSRLENINISIADNTGWTNCWNECGYDCCGFPCQDYSVARKNEYGIEVTKRAKPFSGKSFRATRIIRRDFFILENVDRL